MVRRAREHVVRYYLALKLVAGAALRVLPVGELPEPIPIVRSDALRHANGFDCRELVERDGALHVVTLPVPRPGTSSTQFGLN